MRARLRERDGRVRQVLISFGGSDPANVTATVLTALRDLDLPDLTAEVVVGGSNPRATEIEALCSNLPRFTFWSHVEDMAARMADADLAIGGGGTSTWERCCLRLPSLVIATADHQVAIARAAAAAGVQVYLGTPTEVRASDVGDTMRMALGSAKQLVRMGQLAGGLTDGLGAERVVATMCEVR